VRDNETEVGGKIKRLQRENLLEKGSRNKRRTEERRRHLSGDGGTRVNTRERERRMRRRRHADSHACRGKSNG